MADMAAKVAQEVAAGQPASTDVLVGTATTYAPLLNGDVLHAYDYSKLSPRMIPEIIAPRGVGVEIRSSIPVISYNTDLVSPAEAPHTLEDVLNPKWKGVIASTLTAIGFDRVAYRPEWSPDRMRGYVGRLSDQVGGLIRGGEQERVASGEFAMLVLNTGSQEVHKLRARGAPVAQVVPEDASLVIFHYLGVPRHSAHPNLAKLFVNVTLSEEGQRLIYETAFYDHYRLPGSQTAAELAELHARGTKPLVIDVQFFVDHPEMAALREELIKVMVEKRGG
jgi:iron(III) transport system substrate-binding protein